MVRIQTMAGVKTKAKLRGIHPLLSEWITVVKDYCASDRYQDNPWWYNERASLSTLAGAAWRLPGWSALEEFSTTKRGNNSGRPIDPGKIVRGRCDLYVSHGSTSFAFEAKQVWQSIGRRSRADHVPDALSRAVHDAGNLTADQADHRLGVAFVVPTLPLSEVLAPGTGRRRTPDAIKVRECFVDWIKTQDLDSADAYAYVSPARCEHYTSGKHATRVYPGVLAVIRRSKTGTKRVTPGSETEKMRLASA